MNEVFLRGNVGKDPVIKTFQDGGQIANFSIATQERYRDKEGKTNTVTDWHNLQVWGKLCSVVEKYVKKGDSVLIRGKLKTRSYDDKDGNKKYITEVHVQELEMLTPRSKHEDGDAVDEEVRRDKDERLTGGNNQSTGGGVVDDDLPF